MHSPAWDKTQILSNSVANLNCLLSNHYKMLI